jgi:hypothetical protein
MIQEFVQLQSMLLESLNNLGIKVFEDSKDKDDDEKLEDTKVRNEIMFPFVYLFCQLNNINPNVSKYYVSTIYAAYERSLEIKKKPDLLAKILNEHSIFEIEE